MRTAQICDACRSVWRSDPRLVFVLGAQAAWSFSATEALKCPYWSQGAPCSGHAINAVAVAPYMGDDLPATWTSEADGDLEFISFLLFAKRRHHPTRWVYCQVTTWARGYITNRAPDKLPLLAYEGGQNIANGATDALTANREPRMGQAYARYFQEWKNGGGQLFIYFNDVGTESKYGSWSALESIMQTSTLPMLAARLFGRDRCGSYAFGPYGANGPAGSLITEIRNRLMILCWNRVFLNTSHSSVVRSGDYSVISTCAVRDCVDIVT